MIIRFQITSYLKGRYPFLVSVNWGTFNITAEGTMYVQALQFCFMLIGIYVPNQKESIWHCLNQPPGVFKLVSNNPCTVQVPVSDYLLLCVTCICLVLSVLV